VTAGDEVTELEFADGTDTVYWDGELAGFGIRVPKSGRKNYSS